MIRQTCPESCVKREEHVRGIGRQVQGGALRNKFGVEESRGLSQKREGVKEATLASRGSLLPRNYINTKALQVRAWRLGAAGKQSGAARDHNGWPQRSGLVTEKK